VKNLDDAIDRAENRNPRIRIVIRFCPYEAYPTIGLSDKDEEILDQLKCRDIMEMEKSKYPTPPSNLSEFLTNYKHSAVEIPAVNIDQS
jgi:hypothetical protein